MTRLRPLALEDRLTPSGDLDLTFNGTGFNVVQFGSSPNDDQFWNVTVDDANRTIAVGEAGEDIIVVRFRPDGTLDTQFSGDGKLTIDLGGGFDEARGVIARADGSLLVAGNSEINGSRDFALLDVSPTGVVRWSTTRDLFGEGKSDFATGLAVNTTTGDAYVVGGSASDVGIVRFSAAGTFLGETRVDISGADFGYEAAVDPASGRVYVSASADDQTTFAAVRVNANLSNAISATFNLGSGDESSKGLVFVPATGQVYFGGTSKGSVDQDFTVVRTDGSLNQIGKALVFDMGASGGGVDRIRGLVLDSAGRIVATGRVDSSAGNIPNVGVARFSQSLVLDNSFAGDGTRTYNPGADDRGYSIALAPDGRIVVAGQNGENPLALRILPDDNLPPMVPPNTPPVVIPPANTSVLVGTTPVGPLTVLVSDLETPASILLLNATSNNPGLFPNANIVLGGAGTNRALTMTPAAGVTGMADITLIVTDQDGAIDTETFTVTVRANSPPVISAIADQTVAFGFSTPPLTFTVNDFETPAAQLTVTGSSNNSLVPPGGFVFTGFGSGSARTVTITPAAGQSGTATITLLVTDANGGTATEQFLLTVTPNGLPTISDVPNQMVSMNGTSEPLAFIVGDAETPVDLLSVVATSNTTLIPTGGLVLTGTGANRTITVTPAAGQFGSATVTLTVTDGSGGTAFDTFTVTVPSGVPPINSRPTITDVPNQTIPVSGTTGPLSFTVTDNETPAGQLQVTVSITNTTLLPTGSVVLGGSGSNRTVTVTPTKSMTGTAVVTLTVSDGALTATDQFVVTVGSTANTPPTITGLPDATQETPLAQPVFEFPFTVGDAETPADQLTVTATQTGVGSLDVSFRGTGANRIVRIGPGSPILGGQTTVTLTVRDAGGLTASDTVVYVLDIPSVLPSGQFGVGQDVGGGSATLFNDDLTERFTVTPFGAFGGGVRVAVADFNRDGVGDLVTGTGPSRSTQVTIFDGKTQNVLFTVAPFESTFVGGVYLAVGDLNGDGTPDLVITPDEGGGPRVDVYSGVGFGKFASFFGIDDPNFRGGARAAVGELNGDARDDLIVVAGFGGGPRVAGFSGRSIGSAPVKLFGDFFAFEQTLRNGIFVTVGDLNGDGFDELIAGGGPGGGPRVLAFDGQSLLTNQQIVRANFFGGDANGRGGIRLTVGNLDGDSRDDLIVGAGTGAGDRATAYLGKDIAAAGTPPAAFDLSTFDGFVGGVFVG